MSIGFGHEDWQRIRKDAAAWWDGTLARPLICARLSGYDSDRAEPDLPAHFFTSFYDDTVSVEQIIDRWDYDLSRTRFLGDGFPHVLPNFGPGVIAAFMGAQLENGRDTVWFHPTAAVALDDLRLGYDPRNPWLQRVKALVAAADARWEGQVCVSLTDLGGNLDILSTFRPADALLLDLYDRPAQVERLTWQAHEMWWRYYQELHAAAPRNPGYTAWDGMFSAEPFYMLQCDFAYMIGPDMFERFVKPELQASAERLTHAFYHLDGPGQLNHLDALLGMDAIAGIQWVPGAGQPDITHWPEVYRQVRAAGKRIQIFDAQADRPLEALDALADQLGDASGIVFMINTTRDHEDAVLALLERHGAPLPAATG